MATTADVFGEVPSIDLSGWLHAPAGNPQVCGPLIEQVRRACHEVGFFYVTNHGIAQSDIDRYMRTVRAFFALPAAVKASIDKVHSPHFRGWERLGSELTNNEVDYREQLDIGVEREAIPNPEPFYWCLAGPNQWPPESALPGLRATVAGFLDQLQTLSAELLSLMSLSLGLEANHIAAVFGEQPQPYCKLIRYPPTPGGSHGVGAHKDSGFLTLLLQDNVGGLQAQNVAGQWIDVSPVPGTLVVNIGELLQIMTHNYFVATPHRVFNRHPQRERHSSAYFYSPDLDTRLEPLPIDSGLRAAARASPNHRDAGLMASRADMAAGTSGMGQSAPAARFGDKYWHRWVRSYPAIAKKYYPDHVD